jgi:hypothetical protein
MAGADNNSSSCMRQLGTCRALLTDSDDGDFELDPFPAAVPSSPSSHRHGHTAQDGYKAYAGLEVLQVGSMYILCCACAPQVLS